MTDDLEHLETAFHEARELPPEERSAFLHRLRTEDPETAQEVEALLELDEEESGILERLQHRIFDVPSTGGDTPSVDPGDTTMVGRRVGAYRITGLLGRGGMGAVYRAEREQSPFEQTVALKLLAMGVDSPVARMRFDQERRILARLQHPGIASILDGGVADDGTPWFAMELVDGRSIDVHCDEERLSLGGRIRLFLEVCRAVEHAHGRLVLHRDLKPGNALVNAEGRVRLLDFGIGRVLEGPETSTQPALTQMGRAFTPGFASPEQLRGEAAEVSSDVYSLGVLLHLLLVGRSTESIGPDGEPLRPNEVLRKLDEETRQRIAAARRQTPEGLGRALDGDLRWILRRALAPDPGARYPVVQALRADLERYLDGRVVQAHPPSRWYSLRRWARRNRAAVAVAAALLVGSVGSVAGMVRAAAAEREAREEAALSAAVNEFLESLFRLAVSDPAAARSTSAAEVLQQGVSRADETLSDIPGLHARVLTALGVSYQGMGLTAEADSVLARAVEVADGADPPDAAARANARVRLAAHVLQTGQGARADSLSRQALAILRAAGEVKEWETWANAHAALGGAHQLSGRYDSARAEFEAARAVAVEATGGRYVRPRHLLGLGFLQYSLGELTTPKPPTERRFPSQRIPSPPPSSSTAGPWTAWRRCSSATPARTAARRPWRFVKRRPGSWKADWAPITRTWWAS